MANIIEILPEIAETVIALVPEVVEIPIAGRIIVALLHGHGADAKALEELQKVADKKKTDRQTRRERNNRYVLKASDAMQCVEDNLMNGKLLLSFGKGIANAILGRPGGSAPDLILDNIWTCIEEHVLRQDTPRVIVDRRGYHRPAKGHGHGRGKK